MPDDPTTPVFGYALLVLMGLWALYELGCWSARLFQWMLAGWRARERTNAAIRAVQRIEAKRSQRSLHRSGTIR